MENQAEEKLRIMDVIKNNATTVVSIGAFVWILFSYVILPIQKMQFQVSNILDNHLATIQTELTEEICKENNLLFCRSR
jgi:hypothetical protein